MLIFLSFQSLANFGDFASAIYLKNCTVTQFYNVTGSGANCINPTCGTVFPGTSFGSFNQNSGALQIRGGEIKTWKNACCGNVCSARMNYVIYTTGARPGTPVFTTINLPFKCGCSSGTFGDGLGPCSGSDQKWSTESAGPIDLTNRAPGNYTIEIYFDYTGDNDNPSQCDNTNYINNGGSPTNYTATFSVVAAGGACALLPIEMNYVNLDCQNEYIDLKWETASEKNAAYYQVDYSTDGFNWDSTTVVSASGNKSTKTEYEIQIRNIQKFAPYHYIQLKQFDIDGIIRYIDVYQTHCYSDVHHLSSYPNPSDTYVNVFAKDFLFKGTYELRIVDSKGFVCYIEQVEIKKGSNIFAIETKLPPGMYFIQLKNDEFTSELVKHIQR